jgi:hypothetical protein
MDQSAWAPPTHAGRLLFELETLRFILVSALDLMMTSLLLRQPHFTEANPVALVFLDHWGLAGMVWFKLMMVTCVVALTQTIARHRPETARRLLDFATFLCAAVVVYGVLLFVWYG